MTDHVSDNSKYPICEQAPRMQDFLLVSSFALWAMLIGFAPVMTYRRDGLTRRRGCCRG